MSDYSDSHCPAYCHAVEIIGRRWTGGILQLLFAGASHFSELERAIPSISSRMLSERLKELEAEGIVERVVTPQTPQTPVRVDYQLTAKGRALAPVMRALSSWADSWIAPRPGRRGAGKSGARTRGASKRGVSKRARLRTETRRHA